MILHPLKINTPFTCHEFLSPKFSCAKRKYGAMLKKETHEALKIAKKKMDHMKVPSVEKRKK